MEKVINNLVIASKMAVQRSMTVLRQGILFPDDLRAEVKQFDGTLVTAVDYASEEAGCEPLRAAFPEIPIFREEGGLTDGGSTQYIQWYDSVDGTRLFTMGGSGSTVIWALYDLQKRQVVACTIGEAAYERIWYSGTGMGTRYACKGVERDCSVWDSPLSDQCTVLIDVSHGFVRKRPDGSRHQCFTDDEMRTLWGNTTQRVKMLLLGSNGIHHALVANGGIGAAGAITTAMGGPWDAAGVRLVANAGGIARGFRIEADGLYEADPLDPTTYDLVISAANWEVLDFLVGCLPKPIVG